MTYGDLARAAGCPRGAQAVGGVMAGNPFPLAIPCHRVVKADGRLGEYGGGPATKKALLEGEGLAFSGADRAAPESILSRLP